MPLRLRSSLSWRLLLAPLALLLPVACASVEGEEGESASSSDALVSTVTATVETAPVSHAGDAADDPCVWVHPTDPAQSTIIGTDKLGGIEVYDLSGKRLQYRADGKINNIDIRYGFPLGGAPVALVGGTNRTNRTLLFWKVNADRTLSTAGSVAVSAAIGDVYGFTLYRSAATGKLYAFVVDKNSGVIEQYELDGSSGSVRGTRVRTMDNGNISEGMVADDANGYLYASEETVGVWRYGAEPGAGTARTKVASVGSNDVAADVEGVTIYQRGNGAGYLLVSSQGNSSYAVFDRLPPHTYRGSFRIGAGATIDGTSDTDGIDVSNVNLGPAFPEGVFIAQDGTNTGGNQNFKLVPWGNIARSLSLAIDTSFDPRGGTTAPPPPPPPGSTTTTLVATTATWRYLDTGTDPGTAWRGLAFDDASWKSGVAELGYGDGDESTVVGYGPNASSKYVTTHFRRAFSVASATSYTSLTLRLKRDDGAVVYLNGTEVHRSNMPAGTITATTFASTVVESDAFETVSLPVAALREGNNVLAIEVHQSNASSSDLSMAADLVGTTSAPTATTPVTAPVTLDPQPTGPGGAWTLAFRDEFDGTSLDATKWSPNWFGEGGTMNNVATYASNVSVSGGYLLLRLASQTSGALVHTGYGAGRYQLPVGGYIEARVYFPGSGSEPIYNWPAWWTSGPSWPSAGEHDIAEGLGGKLTVNYHSPSGAHNQGEVAGTWNNAFHVYGVHRKATSADVYWDGVRVKSYATDDNGAGQDVIFNVGASGSRTPQTGTAGEMKVDYVRAWKP